MIVFDPFTNRACEAIEMRRDGKALYEDQTNGTRIICEREAMSLYPNVEIRRRAWPVGKPMPSLADELREREARKNRAGKLDYKPLSGHIGPVREITPEEDSAAWYRDFFQAYQPKPRLKSLFHQPAKPV